MIPVKKKSFVRGATTSKVVMFLKKPKPPIAIQFPQLQPPQQGDVLDVEFVRFLSNDAVAAQAEENGTVQLALRTQKDWAKYSRYVLLGERARV